MRSSAPKKSARKLYSDVRWVSKLLRVGLVVQVLVVIGCRVACSLVICCPEWATSRRQRSSKSFEVPSSSFSSRAPSSVPEDTNQPSSNRVLLFAFLGGTWSCSGKAVRHWYSFRAAPNQLAAVLFIHDPWQDNLQNDFPTKPVNLTK